MAQLSKKGYLGILAIIGLAAIWAASPRLKNFGHDSNLSSSKLEFSFVCNKDTLTYYFTYDSHGVMKGSFLSFGTAGDSHIKAMATGNLQLSCIQDKPDQLVSHVNFSNIQYQAQGMTGAVELSLDGKNIYVVSDKTGEVKEIVFAHDVEQMEKHLVRDIFSQISMKIENGKSHWQSQEEDINGNYIAEYQTVSENELTKKRIKYKNMKSMTIRTSEQVNHIAIRPQTSSRILLGDGYLRNIESAVELTFSQNGDEFAHNSSALSLKFSHHSSTLAPTEAFKEFHLLVQKDENRDDLSARGANIRLREQIEVNALGSDDWSSLVAQLDTATKDDLTPLYLKLKALFYLHPEVCQEASSFLLETTFKDSKFHLLAAALVQAGHEEAQKALLQASFSHIDEKSKFALIGQVGLFEKATPETEDMLKELRDSSQDNDMRQTVNLALANIARAVRNESGDRYEIILRESMAELISCDNYIACVNSLHVLGNLGASESLQVIPKFLEAQDYTIRAAAISTLRFVEGHEAESILIRVLREDQDAEVRNAAAYELSFRLLSQEAFNEMLSNLKHESSEGVRVQILTSLEKDLLAYPHAIKQIETLAKHDVSESVRQKARNILFSVGA